MNKPRIKEHYGLDWNECERYINEKYSITIREYANDLGEYRNFWHWIINKHSIYNGGFFELYEESLEDCNEWQGEILMLFIKEFGDGATYYVEW